MRHENESTWIVLHLFVFYRTGYDKCIENEKKPAERKNHMLTEKENLRRVHNRQLPEWIPCNFAAVQLFNPSCVNAEGVPGVGGEDMFGAKWVVEANAPTGAIPDPKFHIIPDVEELPNWRDYLIMPDVDAMDWEEAARRDLQTFDRGNKMIATNLFDGNFNRLQAVLGTCEALIAFLEEPEAVLDLFEYQTDLRIKMMAKLADYYHPDIFINGDDIASSTGLFFDRDIYETFIHPFEKRLAEAAKSYGMLVQHHICGKCEDVIPDIIATGADVIETMQPGMNDIVKMKELYGDKVIFDGGWDSYGHHNEPDATEEEVRAEVRHILDSYAYDGSWITYGGVMKTDRFTWEEFGIRNGWMYDESRKYSQEILKKLR